MTGDEILKESAATYASLKSYVGTTVVRSKAEIGDTKLDQTSKAGIVFSRPSNFRIEGKMTHGASFTIISLYKRGTGAARRAFFALRACADRRGGSCR